MRLSQQVLNGWVSVQGFHELGLQAFWRQANSLATEALVHALYVILVSETREIPRR